MATIDKFIVHVARTDDGQKLSVRVFIDAPLTENKFCTCLVELSFHVSSIYMQEITCGVCLLTSF